MAAQAMSSVTIEDLVRETAAARGDAAVAREAVVGTLTRPGLASRMEALQAEQRWSYETVRTHQDSIERWLGQLDQRMQALSISVASSRVHPLVLAVLLACAMTVAFTGLVVAGAAAYSVKLSIEQHALERDGGG